MIRRLENIQPKALPASYSANDGNSARSYNAKYIQRRKLLTASQARGKSSTEPFEIGCTGFYSSRFAHWFRLPQTANLPLSFKEVGLRRTSNNSFLGYNNLYEFSGVTGGVAQSAPPSSPTQCCENKLLISMEPSKETPQIPRANYGALRTQVPQHDGPRCPRLSIDEHCPLHRRSDGRVSPFYHDDVEIV